MDIVWTMRDANDPGEFELFKSSSMWVKNMTPTEYRQYTMSQNLYSFDIPDCVSDDTRYDWMIYLYPHPYNSDSKAYLIEIRKS